MATQDGASPARTARTFGPASGSTSTEDRLESVLELVSRNRVEIDSARGALAAIHHEVREIRHLLESRERSRMSHRLFFGPAAKIRAVVSRVRARTRARTG